MQSFVVGLLTPDGVVRVATTTNLSRFLRSKRGEGRQPALPLFAVAGTEDEWVAATSLPLPLTVSVAGAASLLGRARLDAAAQKVVFDHTRRLPPGVAVRLLSVWRDAVAAASVDAPGAVEVAQGGRA